MKKVFFTLFLAGAVSMVFSQKTGDELIGIWESGNGKARVKVDKISDKFYGRIVWLREPIDPETGKPKVDKNNPDESQHNVPLKGYRMLKDFKYNKDDKEWVDGTIYDPESGSLYSCVIKMKDENTLDIRGYIGVKTLGRTDEWKRLVLKK
ncbi:MAG: DUF2147 domain-containing protein [Flavobacteriales bacterium]|nr:DUF2147 domain-containing protein [Flavobacteriales bacterium]